MKQNGEASYNGGLKTKIFLAASAAIKATENR